MISENLAENLQGRLATIELNKILRISMLVDPRFAFDEEFLFGFEWDILEGEFIQSILREKDNAISTIAGPSAVETDEQDFGEVELNLLDENSMDVVDLWTRNLKSPSALSQKSNDSQRETKAAYKAEFNLYRHGTDRPGRDENVFDWWNKKKCRYPLIAEGAKSFLSVPATSVSSERTFSMAGLIYANTLRNRLGAKMAENLMLIKAGLKKTMLAPIVEPDENELNEMELIS